MRKITPILLFFVLALVLFTKSAFATGVSVHVAIMEPHKTIFDGTVIVTGCTVTDSTSITHTFTSPLTLCALDTAAKQGGFSYTVQDSSFGLFLTGIADSTGASDFSTYWSYDASRDLANWGIADTTHAILQNGDYIYFHFDPQSDVNRYPTQYGTGYIFSQQDNTGKILGSDFSVSQFDGASSWATLALANQHIDISTVTSASGSSLLSFLQSHPPTTKDSATDWEKRILAITAIGNNPYDFGGTNYVANLETYYTNHQIGSTTNLNDDYFGLAALLASNIATDSAIITDEVHTILSNQHTDGGFSYATNAPGSDTDDSAAALLALLAAQKREVQDTSLASAIDTTKAFILSQQNPDGGFLSDKTFDTTSNTSSTTWAVMGLTAAGETGTKIDQAQGYIRKNQYLGDGSFAWQLPTPAATGDTTTSSYALLALNGGYWPLAYYTGVPIDITPTPTATPSVTSIPTPTDVPTPTDTPTPTPTNISITVVNQTQTIQGPIPSPQIIYITTNKNHVTPTAPLLSSSVLGATTSLPKTTTEVQESSSFSISSMFVGMALSSFLFYGTEFYKRLRRIH